MSPPAHVPWSIHLPAGARSGELELLADGSLPRRWLRCWAERGTAAQVQDVDGRWTAAEELEERTRRAARRLRGAGLDPGDRVIISAESSCRFVIAYVAALRAGLTVVPLNPAYTEREVSELAAAARPAALLAEHRQATWIQAAARTNPVVSGLDIELPEAPERDLDQARGTDVAVLVYTSGTTGRPKGVPLSHANLLASATAVSLAWRWSAEDRLLLTLPLFHVHGLGVGLTGTLCSGAAVTLRPRFEAADVAVHAPDGATLFFAVPTMYERLVRSGHARALRGLRLLVSGSAPLAGDLAHAIEGVTGQMPLERYGMTETLMLAGNPYEGERRPGTVGLPLPGVELRLDGQGEVQVRGPNVVEGYLGDPRASAEAITPDGWFRTGDIGELDADGYLRLVARRKELIISGGYNVYPREVEEVLATHPAVSEVAVVGRPSERWGEEVTAIVVAAREVAAEELRRHAAAQLAPHKVPKRVEFVGALPRNALGKIVRAEL